MKRRTRRILVAGASVLGVLTVLTIVVHLPVVQVAMGWTHPDGTGACPFGYDTPRTAATSAHAEQMALGFTLGKTSRIDVERWARTNGVQCVAKRRTLECRDVDSALLSHTMSAGLARGTVWFDLAADTIVIGVKSAYRSRESAPVTQAFAGTEQSLLATAGQARGKTGTLDELSLGMFRQTMREFRLGGYRAVIRATNMGDGYLLTENHAL